MFPKFQIQVAIWSVVLGVVIVWCRVTRWLHKHADNLCGAVARRACASTGVIVPPANYSDTERAVEQMR